MVAGASAAPGGTASADRSRWLAADPLPRAASSRSGACAGAPVGRSASASRGGRRQGHGGGAAWPRAPATAAWPWPGRHQRDCRWGLRLVDQRPGLGPPVAAGRRSPDARGRAAAQSRGERTAWTAAAACLPGRRDPGSQRDPIAGCIAAAPRSQLSGIPARSPWRQWLESWLSGGGSGGSALPAGGGAEQDAAGTAAEA